MIGGLTHGSAAPAILVADLSLACLAGAAVYLTWSRLLRLPELTAAMDLAKTLLRRG